MTSYEAFVLKYAEMHRLCDSYARCVQLMRDEDCSLAREYLKLWDQRVLKNPESPKRETTLLNIYRCVKRYTYACKIMGKVERKVGDMKCWSYRERELHCAESPETYKNWEVVETEFNLTGLEAECVYKKETP